MTSRLWFSICPGSGAALRCRVHLARCRPGQQGAPPSALWAECALSMDRPSVQSSDTAVNSNTMWQGLLKDFCHGKSCVIRAEHGPQWLCTACTANELCYGAVVVIGDDHAH